MGIGTFFIMKAPVTILASTNAESQTGFPKKACGFRKRGETCHPELSRLMSNGTKCSFSRLPAKVSASLNAIICPSNVSYCQKERTTTIAFQTCAAGEDAWLNIIGISQNRRQSWSSKRHARIIEHGAFGEVSISNWKVRLARRGCSAVI